MDREHGWVQPRPDLERRLDAALTHRLTSLVAAAGYGKSTALDAWAPAVNGVVHRLGPDDLDLTRLAAAVVSTLRLRAPDLPAEILTVTEVPLGPDARRDEPARASALAVSLAESLAGRLTRDVVLVLDDLDAIRDAPAAVRFVETLVRAAPRRLHLVTASRATLPFATERLRRDHEVLDLQAADLALTPSETAAWCRARLGEAGARLAARLHRDTAGWPAAVRAALDEYVRTDSPVDPDTATTASSAALESLVLTAFAALPEHDRHLLQAATVLPLLTDRLAHHLGAPTGAVTALAARGGFLEADQEGYRLTRATREVLARGAPLTAEAARDIATTGAAWFADHGWPALALRAAAAVDDTELLADLVARHGARLTDRPKDLLDALDRLPQKLRETPDVLRLAGVAHHHRGDWTEARRLLERVAATPAFDATIAYRLGFIEHLRGELDDALALYRRGAAHGKPAGEAAICTALAATVLWLQGDRDGCAALADDALEQAANLGDAAALAAAHTVLAMLAALDGDRRANDAHYLKALEHAERADDVVQQIRIRCNRASHHLEEGAYTEALSELEIAGRLADLTGFAPFTALTLSNRAETLSRLGRLEEAAADAAAAAARWESLGSRLVSYGLLQLAQVQGLRGDVTAAIATYRDAIARAEDAGEVQGLAPALAGLAELLVHDDPDEAAALTARALRHGRGMAAVSVRTAAARVAMAVGRPGEAERLLDEAGDAAQERRDRAGLATVTELRAELRADMTLADEAVRRWTELDDPIGRARAELVRARLGPAESARLVAADVRERMRAIGCHALDARLEDLLARTEEPDSVLTVESLGRLRVRRHGQVIPRSAWQSRKARDLLKILVSRRGRPVSRDELILLLWPDTRADGEDVAAKRLNVVVSTLRSVLDPEGGSDVVVTGDGAVHLDLDQIRLDVEQLLQTASEAGRLERSGRRTEALDRWRAVEAMYTGDFCEEDPYADWATDVREQARHAYVRAAAAVAAAEHEADRYEEAARYWLRLLERDPFDERGHLGLVRSLDLAGRPGDARRRYGIYTDRMRELDIEPAPYPR